MQKKCKNNAKKKRKNAKTMRKKCKLHLFVFLPIFGMGFVRASIFSKIAKNLGKMQKQCKKNAKQNAKKKRKKCKTNAKEMQILEMCMLYKNKFPEVALFLHF